MNFRSAQLTYCALFVLLFSFRCVFANEITSTPSARALYEQLFATTKFQRAYEADVMSARVRLLKKYDVLAESKECSATFDVMKDYRRALDALLEQGVGKIRTSNTFEREFSSLTGRQRSAAMALFQSTAFVSRSTGGASAWLDAVSGDILDDVIAGYTVDEQLAGLMAAKRSLVVIAHDANERIRSQGPGLYANYRQRMLDAIGQCVAKEEAKLLEARIEQRVDQYQRQPKRAYAYSSKADKVLNEYADHCFDTVMEKTHLDHLDEAKSTRYWTVLISIDVLPSGEVRNIKIEKSSGHPGLDNSITQAVIQAAPFAPFPQEIKERFDVVTMTRSFRLGKA